MAAVRDEEIKQSAGLRAPVEILLLGDTYGDPLFWSACD